MSITMRKPGMVATKELVPVIVSVHGGPEGQERPGFNPLYQYYLSRGYAVLATNVRGSTGYGKTFTHLDDVAKREVILGQPVQRDEVRQPSPFDSIATHREGTSADR